jgi:hypothetical protein
MGPPVSQSARPYEVETIMRALFSLLTLAALAPVPTAARADGLIYKLPGDGTRVVYDLKFTRHKSGSPGDKRMVTGTLSVAA